MSGWPFGRLAGKAVLFGLIYAALGVALFGWPVKGALLSALVAGPLFAILMHLLGKTRRRAPRHEP